MVNSTSYTSDSITCISGIASIEKYKQCSERKLDEFAVAIH